MPVCPPDLGAAASSNGAGSDSCAPPPAVSIVLPTFDRAPLIGRSLRSILQQTFTDFELIVVDDASRDGTGEEVARFADPRVRYVRLDRRRGPAGARNVGTCMPLVT